MSAVWFVAWLVPLAFLAIVVVVALVAIAPEVWAAARRPRK